MDEKKNNKQEKTKRITKKVNEDIKEIKILDEDIKTTDKEDKKNKFNTVEVIAIMIITTLFGGFIGSAVTFFKDNKTVGVGNKDLQELISTYYEVVDNYYGDINSEELLESGIKGMINYLDDPYSSYLDPTYSASFNEQLEGEYTGLGAEITNNEEGNAIVKTIFKDSPAEKIG